MTFRTLSVRVALPALVLASALSAAGCTRSGQGGAARAASPDTPVATVDGAPILRGDLERRVRLVTGGEEEADPALRAGLLEQLVEERLLLAEAERRGITLAPADVEGHAKRLEAAMGRDAYERTLEVQGLTPEGFRSQVRDQLLAEAILQTVPKPKPITEHEVRAFYQERRSEFAQPEQYRARVITAASRPDAEALRARLASGADFARLAAEKSTSPERDRGGDLGFVPRGQLPPEFDAAVERLKPGELSPVVESPYGFHVLRLEERRPARQQTLDQAREEIARILNMGRAEAAHERWIADLRAKAKVEILDADLKAAAEPAGSPAAR
jgi:peptidyl-prolyl cis-trans isomerase C